MRTVPVSPETLSLKGRQFTVCAEKWVYGGQALCRLLTTENSEIPQALEKAVIFVSGLLPGETAAVTSLQKRRGVWWAELISGSIQDASPQRIIPECTVFDSCGGCQWQMATIDTQRHWKKTILKETLERALGKTFPELVIPEIQDWSESIPAFETRHTARWQVDVSQTPVKIGYMAEGTSTIVNFDACLVLPDLMNRTVACLKKALSDLQPNLRPPIQSMMMRMTPEGAALLRIDIDKSEKQVKPWLPVGENLYSQLKPITGETLTMILTNGKRRSLIGAELPLQTVGEIDLRVSEDSFFQVNPYGLEPMLDHLTEWAGALEAKALPHKNTGIDLYAGVGTFGFALAPLFEKMVLVESSPASIEDAHQNNLSLGHAHVSVLGGPVEKVIQGLKRSFDWIVLDPPRAGCDSQVLDWVNRWGKDTLIYISCDPTTLARDLKLLLAGGWSIVDVATVDMFPQTSHIESVLRLRKC
ncbi:MAG: 23S rRNA (uracil(1939)-C(5))-methyltransferase RlmD [Cyanobacteria bacterium]|nr:23S rRNA (uracil(1939)-C(5))-methyltransferase RlmD [Cyanobacteriota bacterium]